MKKRKKNSRRILSDYIAATRVSCERELAVEYNKKMNEKSSHNKHLIFER